MGLRDDDAQIFAERDLLDWARSAPSQPGSYDHRASEEELAAYEYDQRKFMERRPYVPSGYDGDTFGSAHRVGGGIGGRFVPSPPKKAVAKKAVKKRKAVAKIVNKAVTKKATAKKRRDGR